jgi:hypothetical protein
VYDAYNLSFAVIHKYVKVRRRVTKERDAVMHYGVNNMLEVA